jgi:hydrogenase maturation protease
MAPWIIGVGNPMRGDDGVGAAVVAHLRADDIPAFAFDGDGAELMEMWMGQPRVIVIDAALSGAQAGTLHRFDAHLAELPRNFFRHSTHQFGVAEAVEMARILGRLPLELIVYGIEGVNFDMGASLSPNVELAAREAAQLIKSDIDA